MLRRDLLRAWLASPLAPWLRPWFRPALGGEAIQEPNAAVIYRKVFGWAEGLRAEDSERLHKAETIAIDDRNIVALIREAGPVLEAIREAAGIDRCHWGTETVTSDDLGKGHLGVFHVNVIRVAGLSARRHARLGRGLDALDEVFAGLTLAHRVGTGGVLFARILECAGEVVAFQPSAGSCPGWTARRSRPITASRRPPPAGTGLGHHRARVAVHPGFAPRRAHGNRAIDRGREVGRGGVQ